MTTGPGQFESAGAPGRKSGSWKLKSRSKANQLFPRSTSGTEPSGSSTSSRLCCPWSRRYSPGTSFRLSTSILSEPGPREASPNERPVSHPRSGRWRNPPPSPCPGWPRRHLSPALLHRNRSAPATHPGSIPKGPQRRWLVPATESKRGDRVWETSVPLAAHYIRSSRPSEKLRSRRRQDTGYRSCEIG